MRSSNNVVYNINIMGYKPSYIDIIGFSLFLIVQAIILVYFYKRKKENFGSYYHVVFKLFSNKYLPSLIKKISKPTKDLKIIDYVLILLIFLSYVFTWYLVVATLFLIKHQITHHVKHKTPVVIPLIPGLTVPIQIIFVVLLIVLVHEFSHGILASRYGIEPKEVGIFYLLLIPFAGYVDIDDERIKSLDPIRRLNIYGAGPVSNLLSGFLALALLALLFRTGLIDLLPIIARVLIVKFLIWFFLLSIAILVVNLIPIPGTDGYFIFHTLKEKYKDRKLCYFLIKIGENLLFIIFVFFLLYSLGVYLHLFKS